MKARIGLGIGLLVLAAAGGCFPEKRVVWSPDGRWIAVVGKESLHICDAAGRVVTKVADNVRRVSWLPDARRLLIVRSDPADTWEKVAECFTAERRQELIEAAESVRRQLRDYTGDLDDFEPPEFKELTGGQTVAVVLYLRDHHADELRPLFGETWKELEDANVDVAVLQLVDWDGETARLGRVVARAADDMHGPRISPDGKAAAYVEPMPGKQSEKGCLVVVSLEDGKADVGPRHVADYVSFFPDWSADGRYLVAAQTEGEAGGDALTLGSLMRRQVRDQDGRLLEEFGESEELAGLLFQPEIRVQCLRDGRIVFATTEIRLPCTEGDMPQQAALFVVQPGTSAVVGRLAPRQAESQLPDAVFFFEVSPDERFVSVPGSHGAVSVLSLATGEVLELVEDEDAGGDLRAVPTWRGPGQLCCVVPPESEGEPAAVVVFTLAENLDLRGRQMLSTGWPESLVRGFLVDDEEKP